MLARVLRENGHPLLSQWDVGKGVHLSPAAAGLLEVDLQGVPHGLLTQYVRDPREQDGPGAAGGLELGRAGSELQQAPWEGTQGRGPIGALAEQLLRAAQAARRNHTSGCTAVRGAALQEPPPVLRHPALAGAAWHQGSRPYLQVSDVSTHTR